MPKVHIVDMREEFLTTRKHATFSRALVEAIRGRLENNEQAIVLLNRRGFSSHVACRSCGARIECVNCAVTLTYHRRDRRLLCHYCGYAEKVPSVCPRCNSEHVHFLGIGSERVEDELHAEFPSARIARLDRDTVTGKRQFEDILQNFRERNYDMLVGTQMIAKGHDFPRVTLVGVVSADVGLGVADFRASERTFQLLTQVAGRAGRGEQAGEAVIQTLYPDHYSIQLACRQDYPAFFERELKFRKAMGYPPFLSIVNTVVRARTFSGAMDDAEEIVGRLRKADGGRGEFRVLGPAPAPLGRLRGEYRVQMLVKGRNRKRMREALRTALADRPELARRTVIDVDPISVL
jgi:primosomal protein N' (replication factor Y)